VLAHKAASDQGKLAIKIRDDQFQDVLKVLQAMHINKKAGKSGGASTWERGCWWQWRHHTGAACNQLAGFHVFPADA
jgi:hypothetical protein